ncbi:MAG: DUF481 domain-containing protein [Deltaproteobacteria bacterium]|nr:DUF481 domain-containing protein [Deltaproteobacteria bacterium]
MLKKIVVAAVVISGSQSFADPKFEFGKAEEVEKVKTVEYNASAEAGIVFTTGNSETTTATAGVKAARKKNDNKLAFDGSLTYAKAGIRALNDTNGNGTIDNDSEITTVKQVTAESYAAKLRYDRFLTKHNSLFLAGLVSRNVPAGKELVLGAQVGYSRQLYKTEKAEAVGEIGFDYSNEDMTVGESLKIFSLRGFVGYKAEMTEGTNFETSAEVLSNLNEENLPNKADGSIGQDTRVTFKASVSSKVTKNLSFQTSLEAKYDHRPGPLALENLAMGFTPEASRFDTTMKASFIYTIF